MNKERYENLDGLRAISCLCIIAMHIKANADYNLSFLFGKIVDSWTQFVPLFLMISGFGMFCGYYESFKKGNIDLNNFYSKRYKKLLPFFVTLILINIILDRTISHIIEGITEATLIFGLLPNNAPDVIGVCWTLGVVFLFYMLFPYTVFLCWTKKRAWITFFISIIVSLLCSFYYFTDAFVTENFTARHNILYCAPWLIVGGIIYLNRTAIVENIRQYRWIYLVLNICLTIFCLATPGFIGRMDIWMIKNILLFSPWLMYAISVRSTMLNNGVMRFLSGISLELYLAQMVVFRAAEKAQILYIFGHGWFSFIVVWAIVVLGLIFFIMVWKKLYSVMLLFLGKSSRRYKG